MSSSRRTQNQSEDSDEEARINREIHPLREGGQDQSDHGSARHPRFVPRPTPPPREWVEAGVLNERRRQDPLSILNEPFRSPPASYFTNLAGMPGAQRQPPPWATALPSAVRTSVAVSQLPSLHAGPVSMFGSRFSRAPPPTGSGLPGVLGPLPPIPPVVTQTPTSVSVTASAIQGPAVTIVAGPPPGAQNLLPAYQSGPGGGSHHAPDLNGRPQPNVRPPLNIDISMVEICTFFPCWLQLPEVIMRAVRNGFRRDELTRLQLNAINANNAATRNTVSNRVQKQMSFGGNTLLGRPTTAPWDKGTAVQQLGGLQNDMTANNWRLRENYPVTPGSRATDGFRDMRLTDIANAVPPNNRPAHPEDRLLLTECLRYAQANPHLNLDTSHWAWIIQNRLQNVNIPPRPAGPNVNRDTVARQRLFP